MGARTAKLFTTGRSQAVRLPAEFRFDGNEVFIRRDAGTGDVILSRKPDSWDGLFALHGKGDVPKDFLTSADRNQSPQDRDPFDAPKGRGRKG
jgi:antitoxin VapB